jgi:hypothetical protein
MFDLRINILRVIKDNLPAFLWIGWNIDIFKVMSKPLRALYAEFKTKVDDLIYKAAKSGKVIDLETALNDKFDPILRRITITDAFFRPTYIYKKSESRPPIILYWKWNTITNFITGKFCYYTDGIVYQSNTTPNINKIPGVDPEWDVTTRKPPVILKKVNFETAIRFNVNVPTGLTYSTAEMKAEINYYKLAGLGYLIRTV